MTDQATEQTMEQKGCPDTGKCHHFCVDRCWRVGTCEPLGIAGYPGDRWPHKVLAEHAPDRIPEWEVFLIDEDGFTLRNDEQALAILRLLPEEDDIREQFGDCVPSEITICRGEAKPQPQSPGSEHLRVPSVRAMMNFLDVDLRDECDPDRAVLLWTAAKGAADALNRLGQGGEDDD